MIRTEKENNGRMEENGGENEEMRIEEDNRGGEQR